LLELFSNLELNVDFRSLACSVMHTQKWTLHLEAGFFTKQLVWSVN